MTKNELVRALTGDTSDVDRKVIVTVDPDVPCVFKVDDVFENDETNEVHVTIVPHIPVESRVREALRWIIEEGNKMIENIAVSDENDGDAIHMVVDALIDGDAYDRDAIVRAFIASYENLDDVQAMVDHIKRCRGRQAMAEPVNDARDIQHGEEVANREEVVDRFDVDAQHDAGR